MEKPLRHQSCAVAGRPLQEAFSNLSEIKPWKQQTTPAKCHPNRQLNPYAVVSFFFFNFDSLQHHLQFPSTIQHKFLISTLVQDHCCNTQ
jgi:hypothetical protein